MWRRRSVDLLPFLSLSASFPVSASLSPTVSVLPSLCPSISVSISPHEHCPSLLLSVSVSITISLSILMSLLSLSISLSLAVSVSLSVSPFLSLDHFLSLSLRVSYFHCIFLLLYISHSLSPCLHLRHRSLQREQAHRSSSARYSMTSSQNGFIRRNGGALWSSKGYLATARPKQRMGNASEKEAIGQRATISQQGW